MLVTETEKTTEDLKTTQSTKEDTTVGSSGVHTNMTSHISEDQETLHKHEKPKDLKKKSVSQIEKERVLSVLDAEDKNIKDNPEVFDKASVGSEDFAQLLEMEYKSNFSQGDVVKGIIIDIQKDFILVDISYKSEGLIPINEFQLDKDDEQAVVKVGNKIEVYIERLENEKWYGGSI